MNQFFSELKNFPKKCDWVLLLLCFVTSAFGCVVIGSATSADKFGSNFRYIAIQVGATIIGIIAFAIVSSIDVRSCPSTAICLWLSTHFCCFC